MSDEPKESVMNRDSTGPKTAHSSFLDRYLRNRRVYSALLLLAALTIGGVGSVMTQIADVKSLGLPVEHWELIVWEASSRVVILALVPAILAFDRFIPLTWRNWRRGLPAHFLASVAFSLVHVHVMLLLRKLAYSMAGREYSFDDWIGQLVYEYLKDVRAYFALLFIVYVYRFVLVRLQGEASELAASETKPQSDDTSLPERFLVRKLDKEFLIAANDVERLESQGNYILLHVQGRAYPLRSTMAAIEARLAPAKFVRVHRSHIVNTDYLTAIEPTDAGDARLTMRDGASVPCSRTYRAALKERVM